MIVPVATFNTAGGIDSSSRFYKRWQPDECRRMYDAAARTIDDVAEVLRGHEVGIVALQETDTSYAGGDVMRQWERLAARLSMDCRFVPSFEVSLLGAVRVRSGIATLSSFPIEEVRTIRFPQRHASARDRIKARVIGQKQGLHVALRVHGRELHVVNAHLTHDVVAQRELELATLLDYCAGLGPTLLMGDLNFSPPWPWPAGTRHPQPLDDDCMAMLRTFRDEYPGTLHADPRLGDFSPAADAMAGLATCPADAPRYKFDWIFLLDPTGEIALSPETVLPPCASDHRPVVAQLVFR